MTASDTEYMRKYYYYDTSFSNECTGHEIKKKNKKITTI